MKHTIVAILLVTLYGCSITSHISGSYVVLNPASTTPAISPGEVTIFLQPPEHEYQVVALLNASTTVRSSIYIAEFEAELVEELRRQSASIGANGVTDVVREVMIGDKVITTHTWGGTGRARLIPTEPHEPRHIVRDRQRQSVVTSDHILIYRGKAISYQQ